MLTVVGKFFGFGYFPLNLAVETMYEPLSSPSFPVPLTDSPVLIVFYSGNTQTRNIRLFPPFTGKGGPGLKGVKSLDTFLGQEKEEED